MLINIGNTIIVNFCSILHMKGICNLNVVYVLLQHFRRLPSGELPDMSSPQPVPTTYNSQHLQKNQIKLKLNR